MVKDKKIKKVRNKITKEQVVKTNSKKKSILVASMEANSVIKPKIRYECGCFLVEGKLKCKKHGVE